MKEHFDLVISIGTDCSVAGSLRSLCYKEASYPFDWAVSDDFEWVIDNFESGFESYRAILPTVRRMDIAPILFPHDEKTLLFVEKYQRRIDRLESILCGDLKVLFVRKGEHDDVSQATRLVSIIEEKYSSLDFKVLLLNNIESVGGGHVRVLHGYISNRECFLKNRHQHRNCRLAYAAVERSIASRVVSSRFRQPSERD